MIDLAGWNPRVYSGFPLKNRRCLGLDRIVVPAGAFYVDGSRYFRLRTLLPDSSRRRVLHQPDQTPD